MDLVRFAELLNNQGELRDLWVKQKIRERSERSRRVRECQKSKSKINY
jgi:hypothetical protein